MPDQPPCYANAFLLRLSTRHHGPDEVWLEPHTVIEEHTALRYGALVMAPQTACSLALGILGMLQEEYGDWEVVAGTTDPRQELTSDRVWTVAELLGGQEATAPPAACNSTHRTRQEGQPRQTATNRQRETIEALVAQGRPRWEIAQRCGVTPNTITLALKRWGAQTNGRTEEETGHE